MDPREVASRLVGLSATGLPLIVGVECDQKGLRAALATAPPAWPTHTPPAGLPQPGTRAMPYPPQQPQQQRVGQVATPPRPPAPMPTPAPPSPAATWGPPQTSAWARGDEPTRPAHPQRRADRQTPDKQGAVGETLRGNGTDGEPVSIRLVEVVDPADFLFSAAGYRLREGERAVVVHTELTNLGTTPFGTLPDLYLLLVAKDGQTFGKAPVSLSSRPPHRMGIRPNETSGGHTVYVVPEAVELTAIRWSATPDEDAPTLTWSVNP
jgi:hypothetical protein